MQDVDLQIESFTERKSNKTLLKNVRIDRYCWQGLKYLKNNFFKALKMTVWDQEVIQGQVKTWF